VPLTPLHIAAAAPAKALLKSRFSVKLFFATQVIIDTEPLTGMAFEVEPIHGFFHTWSGSLVPAALAVLAWRVLADMSIWRLRIDRLSWPVMLTTALYGAWTHVAMDGFMHADVPVWGTHSWATQDVLDELMLFAVVCGAAIAVLTYGLPWAVRKLARWIATICGIRDPEIRFGSARAPGTE